MKRIIKIFNKRSNSDVLKLLKEGKVKPHSLEREFFDEFALEDLVSLRRDFYHEEHDVEGIEGLPFEQFDYKSILNKNCENVVGFIQIPVGISGPLVINDGDERKEYYVPLSTTEGTLVASTTRGMKCASVNGVTTYVTANGIGKGPCVEFANLSESMKFEHWVREHEELIAKEFNSTSGHIHFSSIQLFVVGKLVYMRIKAKCGEAMGINMISKATEHLLLYLKEHHFPGMSIVSDSANLCTEKKCAAVNWIDGRGKSVVSESVIPSSMVESVLNTTVDDLVDLNIKKNLVGSAVAGTLGGFNAHASNLVTALFLATGQDPAQIVECASCLTYMDKTEEGDLYMSCSLPNIETGTIGGGTSIQGQHSCLQILGLTQQQKEGEDGQNAEMLAKIIAATTLCGELSFMSALAAGDLVKAHLKFNR